MGREVRRVPENWTHPLRCDGQPERLREGQEFESDYEGWLEEKTMWLSTQDPDDDPEQTFEDGWQEPRAEDYMPNWPESERTHYQMYENTSEGTPISPVMASLEELARWLADNKASACGSSTATYEEWLAMCHDGWAPSGVIMGGQFMSGVQAAKVK